MNAALVDVQRHLEEGGACETRASWPQAIAHYHRCLTCLPRIAGVHSWFQRYLLNGLEPVDIGPEKISDIYTRLGRCYWEANRRSEAYLCLRAALRWNGGNRIARQLLSSHAQPPLASRVSARPMDVSERPRPDPSSLWVDRLSLVFITHFTDKLKINKGLAPPSTGLISATFGSMLDVFGLELARCPKILCYDRPRERRVAAVEYEKALAAFCREYRFDFLPWNGIGLRAILDQVIAAITTPYVMFVEHDWLFQGGKIELVDLLGLFDRIPGIHMIRFNQRTNVIAGYDFILEDEPDISGMALLRTVAHSNNPAVLRTAKLRDDWLPFCLADPFYGSRSWPGTAFGVEEPLFKQHIQDVRNSGFGAAHAHWGTYLFGGVDEPPRIVHLGV